MASCLSSAAPSLAATAVLAAFGPVLSVKGADLFDVTTYPSGGDEPLDLAAGDFDGDGDLDIVAVNYGGSAGTAGFQVLLNRGDGTFDPIPYRSFGSLLQGVASSDLNGDGLDDIAVADQLRDSVTVLLSNGDGSFVEHWTFEAEEASRIQIVDLNMDGHPDALFSGLSPMFLALNAGDGTFGDPMLVSNLAGPAATMDFDGDGVTDLLIGSESYIYVLAGQGDGSFTDGGRHRFGFGGNPEMVAIKVADLDLDGHLDVVVAWREDSSYSVTYGFHDGAGGFGSSLWVATYLVSRSVAGIGLGDLDGDPYPDLLAVSERSHELHMLLHQGTPGRPAFVQTINFETPVEPTALVAGDFDGDGRIDAATTHDVTDEIAVWLSRIPARQPAPLTGFDVIRGELVSGSLEEMRHSDDQYLRVRSQFGFSVQEPHVGEIEVSATTDHGDPRLFDFSVESRLDHPVGAVYFKAYDWVSDIWRVVPGIVLLGTQDSVKSNQGLDATRFVRSSDGRIELSVRYVVLTAFSARGFHASIDHISVGVR